MYATDHSRTTQHHRARTQQEPVYIQLRPSEYARGESKLEAGTAEKILRAIIYHKAARAEHSISLSIQYREYSDWDRQKHTIILIYEQVHDSCTCCGKSETRLCPVTGKQKTAHCRCVAFSAAYGPRSDISGRSVDKTWLLYVALSCAGQYTIVRSKTIDHHRISTWASSGRSMRSEKCVKSVIKL